MSDIFPKSSFPGIFQKQTSLSAGLQQFNNHSQNTPSPTTARTPFTITQSEQSQPSDHHPRRPHSSRASSYVKQQLRRHSERTERCATGYRNRVTAVSGTGPEEFEPTKKTGPRGAESPGLRGRRPSQML